MNPVPGDARPLVVACVRPVDLHPVVDPLSGALSVDPSAAALSAPDEAAVEHALRIGDAWGGRVVVVTAGRPSALAALAEAAALGAELSLVDWVLEPVAELVQDERTLARALAAAVRAAGTPAVVVCGDRSPDRGTGALPAFLAHELAAAQALGLVALAPDGDRLAAERRLDGGWRERLSVPCPAVCSVEAAGVRLRRAPLRPLLAAAATPATTATTADGAGPGGAGPADRVVGAPAPYRPRTRVLPGPHHPDPQDRLRELTGVLATHDPPQVVGPVGAAEAADALLEFLVRHDYLPAAQAAPSREVPR
jgi:electron transfer flavoprotein beta subunit